MGGRAETGLDELLNAGFRYAMSLSHDPTEAEDLVHDACASILRNGGPMERSYLFTTIRNRFIDLYRRDRRLTFVSIDGDRDDGTPTTQFESGERWELPDFIAAATLRDALETLRVEERETIYLNVVEGYTAQEIAEITNRPRGTILSLLHRTRAKLRDRLKRSEVSHG